jgi:serine/threonine protein kinase
MPDRLAELLGNAVIPGGYAVEQELGRGGMGAVYLVRNEPEGRRRALKVILPRLAADERAQSLFLREMANCQALDHPNVVRTFDSGYAEGIFYLIMEFCDGGSLDRLLSAEGVRPLDEAMAIIVDVLAGLEYAHTAEVPNVGGEEGGAGRSTGLVHRDLKPQNIFLATDGGRRVAKLGDFGLAKAFDLAGLSGMTETGEAAGTPQFMPRQQALNYKYVRPEVDVWAAAATLYTMLTGYTPRDFPPGADRWRRVLRTDPVPILDRGVALPASLAHLIDEALVDRPAIKFKSAAEFRAALESAR